MRKTATAVIVVFCMIASISVVYADRAEDCKALVDKTLNIFSAKGKEAALKAVNSQNLLIDREVYVFALNMDNTVLGHPYKPSLVGKNMNDALDVNGKYFFREFVSVVQTKGSGWVEYWWMRPGEDKPTFKRSYVAQVPGENLYVGAWYYPKTTSLSMQKGK